MHKALADGGLCAYEFQVQSGNISKKLRELGGDDDQEQIRYPSTS